ncbi:hypothetical protein [Caulobacter sp. S45]|uniref:hypothetical protein n=1 Tax=Caulobacter sp. S45 TaxID=1641861 RepID=UPI00157646AF|nr:hypothetical protein [Caulobacter sp. S45]
MVDEATAGKPKKHSAFAQVVFRKPGETLDLGGKAIVGLGGLGSVIKAGGLSSVDWPRSLAGLVVGGAVVALGIYLQAKAEET